MEDVSASALFPDDDHALGPFLGNLPPEILDAVVQKLGWFQTTFAMAGRTCREAVKRVPDTRVVPKSTSMYAARDGYLEVLQWARQNGCPWDEKTWNYAHSNCRPYLREHGCPGAE